MAVGGNNRSRLLLVILLVTSLFLITLDLRGVNITSSSRSATQSFLAPIQRGVSDLFSPVGGFFSDIKNFGTTKSELKELKEENAKLREKVILNEFIGYSSLAKLQTEGKIVFEKSILMATYILCGFANFSSVGIQIGGIGSLVPSKKQWLSEMGMKALLAGTLASCLSATLIGMIMG